MDGETDPMGIIGSKNQEAGIQSGDSFGTPAGETDLESEDSYKEIIMQPSNSLSEPQAPDGSVISDTPTLGAIGRRTTEGGSVINAMDPCSRTRDQAPSVLILRGL